MPTIRLGLSIEISHPQLTNIQESRTTFPEADNPDTSTLASLVLPSKEHKAESTADSAYEILKTPFSVISIEGFREDDATNEKTKHSQLTTAQSARTSLLLSDPLYSPGHLSMLPSMSKETAVSTDSSPLSNDPTLISVKSSLFLSPATEEVNQNTRMSSMVYIVEGAPSLSHAYLQANSPARFAFNEILPTRKSPESSLFRENPDLPSSIHNNHKYKDSGSSLALESASATQEAKTNSISPGLSKILTTYIPAIQDIEESPNPDSTQTSQANISMTSATSDAKSTNLNDLTMAGSKASRYIQKQSLGIILGSISGAGVMLCGILFLYRPCYQRFKGDRKDTSWIANDSENRDHNNNSFARHSEYREISRFSVDS